MFPRKSFESKLVNRPRQINLSLCITWLKYSFTSIDTMKQDEFDYVQFCSLIRLRNFFFLCCSSIEFGSVTMSRRPKINDTQCQVLWYVWLIDDTIDWSTLNSLGDLRIVLKLLRDEKVLPFNNCTRFLLIKSKSNWKRGIHNMKYFIHANPILLLRRSIRFTIFFSHHSVRFQHAPPSDHFLFIWSWSVFISVGVNYSTFLYQYKKKQKID